MPTIADDHAVRRYIELLERIWSTKQTGAIRDLSFAGTAVHAPSGLALHGHDEIDRFVIGYLACFPDARFTVESAVVNRDPERPVRVALRWSLAGQHTSFGHFQSAD